MFCYIFIYLFYYYIFFYIYFIWYWNPQVALDARDVFVSTEMYCRLCLWFLSELCWLNKLSRWLSPNKKKILFKKKKKKETFWVKFLNNCWTDWHKIWRIVVTWWSSDSSCSAVIINFLAFNQNTCKTNDIRSATAVLCVYCELANFSMLWY